MKYQTILKLRLLLLISFLLVVLLSRVQIKDLTNVIHLLIVLYCMYNIAVLVLLELTIFQKKYWHSKLKLFLIDKFFFWFGFCLVCVSLDCYFMEHFSRIRWSLYWHKRKAVVLMSNPQKIMQHMHGIIPCMFDSCTDPVTVL